MERLQCADFLEIRGNDGEQKLHPMLPIGVYAEACREEGR